MTRPADLWNIGGKIAPTEALPALANSAGSRNGAAVDRDGKMSVTMVALVGAVTGSPSAQTYDCKIQDSEDGSTGWADVTDAAFTQKTTGTAELLRHDQNLRGVKRYIRAAETVGHTGGSSPTTPSAVAFILGGAINEPAA